MVKGGMLAGAPSYLASYSPIGAQLFTHLAGGVSGGALSGAPGQVLL